MMSTRGKFRLWCQNPIRPPAWRWYLAKAIFEETPAVAVNPPPDAITLEAIDVLRTASQGPEVETRSDCVSRAHAIWQANGWDRCLLESRLLTGLPLESVAQQLQLPLDVVTSYRDLFFEVSTRLQHAGYIQHHAIRTPVRFDTPVPIETAFRSYAYFGGHHVLNLLLAVYADDIATCDVNDVALDTQLDSQVAKNTRAAMTIWMAPVTEENRQIWLDHYLDQFAAEVFDKQRKTRHDLVESLRRSGRKHGQPHDSPEDGKAASRDAEIL